MNNLFEISTYPGASVVFGETTPLLLLAKASGALAGSVISLAYVLPKGRREAMLRLAVGMLSGFVFGGTAGLKIADSLGMLGRISAVEITLMGATIASLCAWWGLGVLQRIAEHAAPGKVTGGFMKSVKRTSDKPNTEKDDCA